MATDRHPQRRKHRAARARGRDALGVPRLRHVGHRRPRAARRPRRPQAGPPPRAVRDERDRASARRARTRSAPRSSATSWATTTRTATRRSTTRSSAWRRTSRCATRSSTARATSARSTTTPPAAMRYCVTGDTRVATPDGHGAHRATSPTGSSPTASATSTLSSSTAAGARCTRRRLFHSGDHPTLRVRTARGLRAHRHAEPPGAVPRRRRRACRCCCGSCLDEIAPGDRVLIARTPRPPGERAEPTSAIAGRCCSARSCPRASSASAAPASTTSTTTFFDRVLAAYDPHVGGARYVYERTIASGSALHELDIHNLEALRRSRRSACLIGRASRRQARARARLARRRAASSARSCRRSSPATARRRCCRASTIQVSYSTYSAAARARRAAAAARVRRRQPALRLRAGRAQGRHHEPPRRAALRRARRLPRRQAATSSSATSRRSRSPAAR